MGFHCQICDKSIKPKSKNIHVKSFTHVQYEKCFRIDHTIKNPDFFNIDKIFDDYISDHKKNSYMSC